MSTNRQSQSEHIRRTSDATIKYLEERRKNEEMKDLLQVAALKASIRAHESAVTANQAKRAAYEAQAAWYHARISNEPLNYPVPPPLSYSPQWEQNE